MEQIIGTIILMISFFTLVAILFYTGAILFAVKNGFNEVIKGLQSISDQLDDMSSRPEQKNGP